MNLMSMVNAFNVTAAIVAVLFSIYAVYTAYCFGKKVKRWEKRKKEIKSQIELLSAREKAGENVEMDRAFLIEEVEELLREIRG